jgi:hypothetical protein
MTQTTIDKPKVAILTASTERKADAMKAKLHGLGVRMVWVERCDVIDAWAVYVLAEDARGAYRRYKDTE